MSEYKFTKDWFNWAPPVWEQLIPLLPARPERGGREFLEIGSFEGRSTVWIAENMMEDVDALACIDTWEGGEEHVEEHMDEAEQRFDYNRALLEKKFPHRAVEKFKGTSVQWLAHWLVETPQNRENFDFIYIDGSHIAKDVLTDACMAWPLLKPKGLMVFDDYMWGNPRDILHRPKPAIDAFCNLFAEEAEIIHVGYQLVVRKKGE
jgi:predicted O-methyltransferase YrrM